MGEQLSYRFTLRGACKPNTPRNPRDLIGARSLPSQRGVETSAYKKRIFDYCRHTWLPRASLVGHKPRKEGLLCFRLLTRRLCVIIRFVFGDYFLLFSFHEFFFGFFQIPM